MIVSVIGAAGRVGSQITAEAAARGLDVRAFTRTGADLDDRPSSALNISDTAAVVRVVNESDATVISVANRDNYDAVIAAHRSLIAARPTGRIVVVGGAGALQAGDGLLFESPDFPAEFLAEAKTFAAVLEDYRAADGIDWTMVAPSPEIAPGRRTGRYVTAIDTPAGSFVSTQDFAVGVVDELEHPAHQGERFTIASAVEADARG